MWKTPMNNTTKLTVELGDLVENGVKIFDFEYPSYYKGEEKTAFEQKVIDHYYFRQIGFETIGRFKHYLKSRLNEVMPRFISLYKTVEIMDAIEDPFGNVDVTETYKETRTGSDSGSNSQSDSSESSGSNSLSNTSETIGRVSDTSESSQNDNSSVVVEGSGSNLVKNNTTDTVNQTESKEQRFSDTPQGSVNNIDEYLTNATVEDNGTNTETTRTGVDHSINNNKSNTSSSGSINNTTESTGSSSNLTSGESSSTNNNSSSSESSSEYQNKRSETIEHTYKKTGNQGVNTYAHDMVEYRTSIIDVDVMVIDSLNCLFLGVY